MAVKDNEQIQKNHEDRNINNLWEHNMSTITTKDGTQIYYKDWGAGPPVVFSHGWSLNADLWETQIMFPAANGYRCIAHDHRGHGRSSRPWSGNKMDTHATDISEFVDTLGQSN